MLEYKLYQMLAHNKYKFTTQQFKTIKGQIRKGDYFGAKRGMLKIINGYTKEKAR